MPNNAADINNPKKSVQHTIDNRGKKNVAVLEMDAQKALAWLDSAPLMQLTGHHFREWLQSQPWSGGYQTAVRERVQELMRLRSEESIDSIRARLVSTCSNLVQHCRKYRTGHGTDENGNNGTVFLKDPKTGEYLQEIEHSAVQGYLRLITDLTGAKAPEKSIVAHTTLEEIISSSMQDAHE